MIDQEKKRYKHALILGGVGETLLLPLWGRARDYEEEYSILNDKKAFDILNQIDYDFSEMDEEWGPMQNISLSIRALNLDNLVKEFIISHPRATVVCLGSGLETNFYRIDNGMIKWYDLDLPEVIKLRKQILPEPNRVVYLSRSLNDYNWFDEIETPVDGLIFIACGVFMYFQEKKLRKLFSKLSYKFPGSEIVFDWHSKPAIAVGNKKNLEQLGLDSKLMVFSVRNPKKFAQWDERIEFVQAHTRYANIKRDSCWCIENHTDSELNDKFGKNIREKMDLVDKRKISGVVHLRFKKTGEKN